MQVLISKFSESDQCQWCNRNIEGVTAEFESGFLKRGHLCWKCLQRSTRVYAAQNSNAAATAKSPSKEETK